tara:strand:+ start:698 stop:1066 length:369 start_codon:yes stop_codon:yes gene_type:complete
LADSKNKMQNASFDGINPSDLKNFLRKLCIVSNRYTKKDEKLETANKELLMARIHELENELHKTKGEKDAASKENKDKIDELTASLLSIKTRMDGLLEAEEEEKAKEANIRHLENKIKEKVN